MSGIAVLGSTGSIGVSTLEVIARHASKYNVVALTANQDVASLLKQCIQFNPSFAVMADEAAAEKLEFEIKQQDLDTVVLSGVDGLIKVASHAQVDTVMAGIVGAAGLLPTMAAAAEGKRILLANKEALVMSGSLFMDEVRNNNALLLPVDSEHNAIFQSMPDNYNGDLAASGIRQILLTASGGPFRRRSIESLVEVTPDEACAHPNWVMGRKISVDSATMMNKGLEVIEACWLFNAEPGQIQVVIHPQSVIHSMVEYVDGSVLAQLGSPDMKTPIANALAWPERIDAGVERLDFFKLARLDFEAPDFNRFPCLRLAYEAIETGGTATTVLNAANEMAVAAFLDGQLKFSDIPSVIEIAMKQGSATKVESLDDILDADKATRDFMKTIIQ